jgi:hypothetical protein
MASNISDIELYHSPIEKEYYLYKNEENFNDKQNKKVKTISSNYNLLENKDELVNYQGLLFKDCNGSIDISQIPTHIECIQFLNTWTFNKSLDNLLTNNLTHLIFGKNDTFNQKLENLPDTLHHLELPAKYTHNIDNLPGNLKYLHLHNEYNLDNLPPKLEKLFITKQKGIFKNPINITINSLISLTINTSNCTILHLPSNLKYLCISQDYNSEYVPERKIIYLPNYFPENLQYLKIYYFYFNDLKDKIYRFNPFTITNSYDQEITFYHTNLNMLVLHRMKYDQVIKHDDLPFIKQDMSFVVKYYEDNGDTDVTYYFRDSKW